MTDDNFYDSLAINLIKKGAVDRADIDLYQIKIHGHAANAS